MGKTECIDALADLPIEVVSADSMQVYRGMDIGTAKPPADLRLRVPHHLIDIRDPDEQYDVGAFYRDANASIESIRTRGRLPVVCGGTAYYFKHLLYGLPAAPASDPGVRSSLRAELAERGLVPLRNELEAVDPVSAARIGALDGYRVLRALEVYRQTGRPLSSFESQGEPRPGFPVTAVRLTRPPEELFERIEGRVRGMFARGLRAEVERLVARGCTAGCPGMRAIGYREFFDVEGRLCAADDDESIGRSIARDTRAYVKRQLTFFRPLPDAIPVEAREPGRVRELVRRAIERNRLRA